MKNNKLKIMYTFTQRIIVHALAILSACVLMENLGNASDIQIYQHPTAKNNPILMLAIDNSLSMTSVDAYYKGQLVSRINALKSSLIDALNAKDSSGQFIIPENTYIGISVFTSTNEVGSSSDWLKEGEAARSSKILMEAKPLSITHRADLIRNIQNISAVGSTPTPLLLSETYAYLLGNRTDGENLKNLDNTIATKYSNYSKGLSGTSLAPNGTRKSDGSYIAPLSKLTSSDAQCSTQGVFFLSDGAPVGLRPATVLPVMKNALADPNFSCENSPLDDVYYHYTTAKGGSSAPTYNGEFKEMATRNYPIKMDDLGSASVQQSGWQNRSSWACVGKIVQRLAHQTQLTSDARQKRIYTSTVGFGPLFQKHPNETCTASSENGLLNHCIFDRSYTGIGATVSNSLNAQALKILGNNIGKGDTLGTRNEIGGYTQATTGEDIQQALNNFLLEVSSGNFESASFGSYVTPLDPLSNTPYPYIFAPQFQPKISHVNSKFGSTHRLWLGNLKKYTLNLQGEMIDKISRKVLNPSGALQTNTRDFWNISNQDDGFSAIEGGVYSRLGIPMAQPNLMKANDAEQIKTRPIFINAKWSSSGQHANVVVADRALTKITTKDVITATQLDSNLKGWRQNLYQPYLLSALGYRLDQDFLNGLASGYVWDSLSKVNTLEPMRQLGGVLHSDPLLITLEAKYSETAGEKIGEMGGLSHRKDYLLFGTMQGLLHMIDQDTGVEEFAFLPHEILQNPNKRDALLAQSNTMIGSPDPLYGIDGAWTSDVAYRVDTQNKKIIASKANVYGGMRMGGKSYYGLNVMTPASPSFLFHIDPTLGTIRSGKAGISTSVVNPALKAMGQSWSKPSIAKVRLNGLIQNVLIVGGGYDTAYETEGYQPKTSLTQNTANEGAGVYIFNANTGELLWNARFGERTQVGSTDVRNKELKYSVVSQIKVFDRNADGLVDHLYFGDLGGQVWRVDLNNKRQTKAEDFGRIKKIADFSQINQKFYEMPALTIHDQSGQRFGVLSLASGNRSIPLSTENGADHRVYVLHDYELAERDLFSSTSNHSNNNSNNNSNINLNNNSKQITESDLLDWSSISTASIHSLLSKQKRGWYYVLRQTTGMDEGKDTGTVKAMNGYIAIANSPVHSDLYVSLYNPNDPSSQQPNQCSGGIKGSSRTLQLCLPYEICGDAHSALDIQNKKNATISNHKSDGLTKLNRIAITEAGQKKITLLGDGNTRYTTTKKLKAYNWFERQ
ncbi:MAG: pilus assembly protein PilY [Candidatus Acinetobacter avistercoris]|nr:pilus assembly protein PilY [Candidatus Acinetobacter avistercoris]